MGIPVIEEFLGGDSKEIKDLASNEAVLIGFLTMVKGIDDQPDMDIRFYEESRSLYQATSSGASIDDLMTLLADFFGAPVKPPGKGLPVSLRFEPALDYLGGVRKDQAFFLKKMKTGAFYGALWPWQREAGKIDIHLGYHSDSMSDADYGRMEQMVHRFLNKKKIASISDVGGQIHGISLPSFLQMSEMEGATYTLKVTKGKRIGYLYLDGGSLIAAQYEKHSGNEAAYRIISWEKASIQIEAPDPDRCREIYDPLMHVMMESLKIKDEAKDEKPSPTPPPKKKKKAPTRKKTVPKQPASKMDAAVKATGKQAPAKKAVQKKKVASQKKAAPKPPPIQDMVADLNPMELPDNNMGADPVALDTLAVDTVVSVPFEKATDRSAAKQAQMSRQTKLLIVLAVVIVFAAATTGGGKLLHKQQLNRRYDRLLEDLAVTKQLDAQIVLIMQYLQTYPNDSHRPKLERRLKETHAEIEKNDYDKTILEAKRLPIDERYEQRALSLYTAFLTKYPKSKYSQQINEAIGGIRKLMGSAFFEDLKQSTTTDSLERYKAYREYLIQFPESAERQVVEQMIINVAGEYLAAIQSHAEKCDAEEKWDDCIAECDRFLSAFTDEEASVEKVNALRGRLQDKKDFLALKAEAANVADDFAKARKVYSDYLKDRPDTTQKEEIAKRIDALNKEMALKAGWEKTLSYAANREHDIFSRVQLLDAYLDTHGTGPYTKPARRLRDKLDPELEQALRVKKAEAAQRREMARRQADAARRARETQRVNGLRAQVAEQFRPLTNRFTVRSDGTVSDRKTGLTWCLLDSRMMLGRCISYQAARSYVRELTTGGHSDWRLPTAGELATIYKNSPFFPQTGAQWYWSSEYFAKGYHRVVNVVTSQPETVFKRVYKTEDSCGVVRAVRK
ncbi:MAG: hypothetical protein CSA23_01790 [Deltaproteobacteria bacterium]|nr:MAG: hypothetical protein CSA23_01790 [Deltaproteobacteria bacterium]